MDWHSRHSVGGDPIPVYPLPCWSPIRLYVPHSASYTKPPFPVDDRLPQGGHIAPVHLSSSAAIAMEASLAPQGPLSLFVSHPLPLTFSERFMFIPHQPLPWEALDGWQYRELLRWSSFVYSMTVRNGTGVKAKDTGLDNNGGDHDALKRTAVCKAVNSTRSVQNRRPKSFNVPSNDPTLVWKYCS